jgi:hypothetical protein
VTKATGERADAEGKAAIYVSPNDDYALQHIHAAGESDITVFAGANSIATGS